MIGKSQKKYLGSLIALTAILGASGCHKKAAAPLPPAPAATETVPAPTAEITANPTVVSTGGQVTLTWHTTNATEVSIEGVGEVPSSGTKTVIPSNSTTYHLVAKNDSGTADATARVTVNAPPPAAAETTDTSSDETIFHQQVQDVFYDYDSYEITAEAQANVAKAAAYLNAHPQIKVLIGGYCDERGSSEYNLALGEDRANAAQKALIAAGVSANRLRTVSYGKEKQFCSDHTEQCWQQNRRAGFNLDK